MPRFIDIDGETPIAAAAEARAAIGAQQVFDVTAYGATGNGSTDDRSSIQDAVNAAYAAGGGSVWLPIGSYKITDRILMKDNVELCGTGNSSVITPIYPASGTPNKVIGGDWAAGNVNVTLRNFRIDRSGANVQHGILMNRQTNLVIDGVSVVGAPSVTSGAIGVSPFNESGAPPTESANCRVVNCQISECGNFGIQFGFVDGCVIANNIVQGGRELIGIEPYGVSATCKNVVVSGNVLIGQATVDGSQTGLLTLTQSSGGTILGCSVIGNTMRQADDPSDTNNEGIGVYGGTNVSVTGNTVYNTDGAGIQIGNASNSTAGVVVSGNSVYNCSRSTAYTAAGILLNTATHTTVVGNYVYGADHTYGVEEANSASNNFIAFNFLRDANPTNATKTGTMVVGNKNADGNAYLRLGAVDAAGSQELSFIGASGSVNRNIGFYTADTSRWFIQVTGTESGSNTGSDMKIRARTDAGDALGDALTIDRSSLRVTTGAAITVGSVIDLGDASDTTLSRSSAGVLAVEGVAVPTVSSTSTLTNKTIQGTKETVHAITDGAAFEIDPRNGGIQTVTLGASRTPKATNFTAGHSMMLMVAPTANTITWTDGTLNPTWVGGAAPVLSASQQTVISLWEVGTTIYGSLIGYA